MCAKKTIFGILLHVVAKSTKTIATNFNEKKVICETKTYHNIIDRISYLL